jgi:AcrR family transcriptional regulator
VIATRRANRGPSAAAHNRAALIAAARDVFASRGFDAPLSLIARRAGVGQGSLYRHFGDRASLVLAVFEDNISDLEARSAEPSTTLDDVLADVIDQLTASVAFIEVINPVLGDQRLVAMRDRVQNMFARKLTHTTVGANANPEDLMLALSMLATLLARIEVDSRREVAVRAWSLLRRGLDL